MDEAGLEKVKPSLAEVGSDAVLTIIAGADTTSCAMTSLFWLILSNPECYKRLQKEIDSVYPPGSDPLDVSKHSNLPFLAACMFVIVRFTLILSKNKELFSDFYLQPGSAASFTACSC